MQTFTAQAFFTESHHSRSSGSSTWALAVLALFLNAGKAVAEAQENLPPPTSVLKKLSITELLNLQVTSVSKHLEKLSEAASAIQVVTQEDIQRSGATSIPEALRLASNLEVAQINSRQWAISARGLNTTTANELLVLIDGRSVYTPRLAGVFWDVQDTLMEDIDRIEVISGPGASLWGANAVNGVINVITKTAKDTQGLLLEGGGGTELRGFGGVRYGGTLAPNVYYRIYGKYFDRDSSAFPSGRNATNDWSMGQSGFRMDWDAPNTNLFTVQGDLYSGQFDRRSPNGDVTADGRNVVGRWSHTISEDSDFKLQLYYEHTYRNTPNLLGESLDTYDIDFQHRSPAGERNDITWGIGYRLYDDNIHNTPNQAYFPPHSRQKVFSGFVQDKIALIKDRLHLILGTKVERNDYTEFEIQPSGRLAWTPSERQTVWTAISRAVRTPARNDRELFVPGNLPFTQVGGTDFVSEKLVAYELGYRVEPSSSLGLTAAIFYDDYDDIRSVEKVNPPAASPTTVGNGQQGKSYGAELTADYRVTDRWRLRAGYTAIQAHLRPKPGSTDTSYGGNESHDPKHQISLRSSLDLPGHFAFDTDIRYVSRIANQSVPAYCELDTRLAWEPIPKLEIALVGQNLLHDQHLEFGAPAGRQEIERSIYGKVVWRY